MTDEEMISSFLKTNKATQCPDEFKNLEGEIQSRQRRHNTPSNLAPFRQRQKQKYAKDCLMCNKEFTSYPQYENIEDEYRIVNGEFIGDKFCNKCVRAIREGKDKPTYSYRDRQRINAYGSLENYSTFVILSEEVKDADISYMPIKELEEIIVQLTKLIEIKSLEKYEVMLGRAKRMLMRAKEDEEWENL